jgi:hypothetical protein
MGTATCRFALTLVLASVLLAVGCGDDDGPQNGDDCPDVSGAYEITKHSCNPATIGHTMTLSQSECKLTQFAPWTGWTGTVAKDGAMTWTGDAGGTQMTCAAKLEGSTINATCTPSCEVTAERQ